MPITHSFVSGIADGSNATLVRPSNWNADHTVDTGTWVRTSTKVVAASDADATCKLEADYVCDGTADDIQIQAAIDALPVIGGWQVGHIHLTAGIYDICAKITPPQGVIYHDITIEGEGYYATRLLWNTGVVGDYILEWSSATSGYRSLLHLKNLGLYGGGSGTETGKALNITSGHNNAYFDLYTDNVYAGYCASPAINLDGLHLAKQTGLIANSNTGWDVQASSSIVTSFLTEIVIIGGSIQKTQVTDQGLQVYGGNLSHVDVTQCTNMGVLLSGVYFDPVPTGYVSNVILGSGVSTVRNPLIEGCVFKMPQTELQAGGFYIDLQKTIGANIRGNAWRAVADGNAPTTYINIASGSYFNNIDESEYFPYERITDASAYNRVKGHDTLEHWGGGGGTAAVTTSEAGFTFTNLGASGTWTFDLPQTVHIGLRYKFVVLAAQELRINPGAAGGIYINGTKQTDNMYISADDEGESVELITDGNGDWIAFGAVGTWTVEIP